jgi:RND superfamily putative drug exporter
MNQHRLAIDYDLFLFSRVVEYRKSGYSDRTAIVLAVGQTGGIISAAGLVMALAFGGLMLSSTMTLVEFGFLLAFAVMVDTFVIRTLLVPAILFLAGPVNWYPQVMPVSPEHDEKACLGEDDQY